MEDSSPSLTDRAFWRFVTVAFGISWGCWLAAAWTGADMFGNLQVVLIYSVLFTWVSNNNRRSVLAVILFHFSINFTSRALVLSPEIYTYSSFILLVLGAGVVCVFGPGRLVRAAKGTGAAGAGRGFSG